MLRLPGCTADDESPTKRARLQCPWIRDEVGIRDEVEYTTQVKDKFEELSSSTTKLNYQLDDNLDDKLDMYWEKDNVWLRYPQGWWSKQTGWWKEGWVDWKDQENKPDPEDRDEMKDSEDPKSMEE